MSRIMIAGDIHGDREHLKYLYTQAQRFGAECILQLGDFGYWEHENEGTYFLADVEKLADETGIEVFFIPGNHENWSLLNLRYTGIEPERGVSKELEKQLKRLNKSQGPWSPKQTDQGFWTIRDGLYYIPDGSVWTWGDVRFASLGGAHSVDINRRRPGTSWWPEEAITTADVNKLAHAGKVDVFVSHDAPIEIDMASAFLRGGHPKYFRMERLTERNRALLSRAVEFTHPDFLFHGHYHVAYRDDIRLEDGHEVKVNGLSCNGSGSESFTIFDLTKESLNDKF